MTFDLVGKAVKILKLPTVDYSKKIIPVISAQYGDSNSRVFCITLFDDRGDIALGDFTIAKLNAVLPDETETYSIGKFENGAIYCKLTSDMLSLKGKVSCDISLYGSDTKGSPVRLTSQTFYVLVSPSMGTEEAIEGEDDYSLLMALIAEVSNGVKETLEPLKQACEEATSKAEGVVETVLTSLKSLPCDITLNGSALAQLRFIELP